MCASSLSLRERMVVGVEVEKAKNRDAGDAKVVN